MIELLIVIVIIGILSVGLIPKVLDAPKRARDTARKADLKSIQAALTSYYADYKTYPKDTTQYMIPYTYGNGSVIGLDGYFQGGKIPKDPTTATGDYYYHLDASGSCYILATILEVANGGNSKKDPTAGGVSGIGGTVCSEPLTQGAGKFLYVIGGM